METWGRRGFAAAVITGGLIGLSGASGEVAPVYWTGDARLPGRRPPYPPPAGAPGATRYGVPEYPAELAPADPRSAMSAVAAEQTMITSVRPGQVAGAETASARHAAPDHGQHAGSVGLDSPTAGFAHAPVGAPSDAAGSNAAPSNPALPNTAASNEAGSNEAGSYEAAHGTVGAVPDATVALGAVGARTGAPGATPTGVVGEASLNPPPAAVVPSAPSGAAAVHAAEVHGSDGFLAGNLAALAAPATASIAGTPIGALGPAEGSTGTSFDSYGGGRYGEPGVGYGRAESRHARPEQPEQYPGWFGDRSAEAYRDVEPYRDQAYGVAASVQQAHTTLVPQVTPDGGYLGQPTSYAAEQPVRSPELVGVSYPGAAHQPGSVGPALPRRHGRHGQPESDSSALGSLDSSDLFESLSQPPR